MSEEKVNDLLELRIRAKALGVKNTDNMNTEKLEERINVMLKVRLEGLTRLEFDDDNKIIPSLQNLRILNITAVEPKHSLTRVDVLRKLQGYRLITDKLQTTTKHWTRYIDINDGFLRAGGFPIRNKPEEEFIVFKNVSKKFTFSVKRENVILMEKLPQTSMLLLSSTVLQLIMEFKSKARGRLFVSMKDNFNALHFDKNKSGIAKKSEVNRSAMGRAYTSGKVKYKNFFLFKLSPDDKDELETKMNALTSAEKLGNRGIPIDLLQIIDRFYPN